MRRLALVGLALLSSCISFPDRAWEGLQAKHPRLYQLDNTPAKSWLTHSLVTVSVGHLLALTPWIDAQTGMRAMVLVYFTREVHNILNDGNRRYGDAAGDVLVPLAVVELWGWLR